ncbi:MAG: hypothetical protein OIN85_04560 [Candidatus Methanoperedens sp.]|nr:hypothetical protein [Candidatus Methanoperedens sp.]
MKRLIILIIFLLLWPTVCAAEKINGLDVEWGSGTSYTLSWTNPTVTVGDYVIRVYDFDWQGNAVISVTRKGVTQNGIISNNGEDLIFDFTGNSITFHGILISMGDISNYVSIPGVVPVNVGTFPCCPQATITIAVSNEIAQKKPVLELDMQTNWDGGLGRISDMHIEINNTGDADLSEGNVTINLGGLIPANDRQLSDNALTYNPNKGIVTRGWSTPLLRNNSFFFNISIKSPVPSNKTSFIISAQSYFKDSSGNLYSATQSETVSLTHTITITKSITSYSILGDQSYGDIDKFFSIGKETVVNLNVANTQSYSLKSVTLTDTVLKDFNLINSSISPTKNFKLINNNTLQWVFDLNSSESRDFEYHLTARKIGSFTTPAAAAQWNDWGVAMKVSSNTPATHVYGAYVVVTRKTDKTSPKLNESLSVTTTLENIGDFPVALNASDVLPKNTTFISGTMAFSGYLYPTSKPVSFNYNLSFTKPGVMELPSPIITFWKKDYDGSFGVIPANKITVIDPSLVLPVSANVSGQDNITPAPTPTPIPKSLLEIIDEKMPWLEGAVPIIMLIIAIILMLALHVINRES